MARWARACTARSNSLRFRSTASRRGMLITLLPPALPLAFCARDGNQIIGDHTPAHPTLKAVVALVQGTHHAEAVLERGNARLDLPPPAQRAPKPALLLQRFAGRRELPPCWQC